jgi:dTDP-4-dehydrorhamnose reductase
VAPPPRRSDAPHRRRGRPGRRAVPYNPPPMRIAIIGSGGQVGAALLEAFADADVVGLAGRADCDVTDLDAVRRAVDAIRPGLIISTAAMVDVGACERRPADAYRVNALGARWLAQAAESIAAGVVYFSSDYVFDGRGGAPYSEWAPTAPLSAYGRSKLAGETETLSHAGRAWVIRTSWVFGGRKSFVNTMRGLMASRDSVEAVADEVGGPTYAPDLARATRALVERRAPGLYHLSNAGECSRFEWARAIAELTGARTELRATTRAAFSALDPAVKLRPAHSTLANHAAATLGVVLRPWREALAEHLCVSA